MLGGGGARGRGGTGDARGGSGGTVWRWVEPTGRLTVVSRTSRRGGEENLPTPGAGSRHNLGRMSERIGLLPAPAPAFRWMPRRVQRRRTRSCGLYSPSGPQTPASLYRVGPRPRDHREWTPYPRRFTDTRTRGATKNWPAWPVRAWSDFQIRRRTRTTKRARGVHTDTVTRSSWPISRSDTGMGPPMRFCTAWCVRGLPRTRRSPGETPSRNRTVD